MILKTKILITLFVFNACIVTAQVKVNVENKKIVFTPPKDPDHKYSLPVVFQFDVTKFEGQTVSFYSAEKKDAKIAEAVFGDDINELTDGNLNRLGIFRIEIKGDKQLDFDKNNRVIDNIIFLKVGNSDFSSALKFEPSDTDKADEEYKAGSAILDAITLAEMPANGKLSDKDLIALNAIAKFYKFSGKADLDSNKFLSSEIGTVVETARQAGKIQTETKKAISSALSSVGGLDVTTIADGLAKFIVKRTKEELTLAFFDKFKDELEKYPDLKTVFPNTTALLEAIGDEIYNYANYLNNLREAFREDLKSLEEHLPGIIKNHEAFFNAKGNYAYAAGLLSGCYVSKSIREGMHPGDILDLYPSEYLDGAKDPEDKKQMQLIKGSIQSLQLFNKTLRTVNGDDEYWVPTEKVRDVVNDKRALKIFMGLALQIALTQYDGIKFTETITFYNTINTSDAVTKFDESYPAYKQYLLTLRSKTKEIERLVSEHQKATTDSLRVEQFALYFKTTTQFIEHCVRVAELPLIKDIPVVKEWPRQTKDYFTIGSEVSDLTTSINRKQYSEAVNHLVVIYDIVVKKRSEIAAAQSLKLGELSKADKKKVINTFAEMNPTDLDRKTSEVIANDEGLKDIILRSNSEFKSSSDVLSALTKYGAFMASIVNAKTSDEVAAVIESAALPTGSSRIKRESNFNVAINAYSGLFYGREVIRGLDKDTPFSTWNSFGVTVPVGISISRGHRILPFPLSEIFKTKAEFSSTWFISLIDIGAIAAYRFQNDKDKPQAEQIPNIQLKDIVSPGLFWSVGIPKTPISVNLGAQFGPNLRKVNDTTNDFSEKAYVRYSMSICVDIPLLNLYSKTK
jgi:hypothetical protein